MNKKYKYRGTFFDEEGIRHDIRADTKKDLDDKITKLKADLAQGYTPLRSNTLTVKKWSDMCFEKYKSGLDPNTFSIQKSCFDKWVNGNIGAMRLKDVKPLHCQDTMNRTAGKLSGYTIKRVYHLMRFVFDKAVDNNLIRRNPAMRLSLPEGSKKSRRALSKYEEDIFFRAVEKRPEYVFFLVMIMAGLRNSEVARLQGKDLILIEGERFLHVEGTKTKSAVRDVPCPDYLFERLPEVEPFQYMFTNQVGGKMNKPNYERLWKHFKKDMNIEAGCRTYRGALVPPYPIADDLCSYDLRHTFCTNLMKAGIDLRLAQKYMGHSDVKMTANIYSHADTESIVEGAKKLNEMNKNHEEDRKVTEMKIK